MNYVLIVKRETGSKNHAIFNNSTEVIPPRPMADNFQTSAHFLARTLVRLWKRPDEGRNVISQIPWQEEK